MKKLFFVMAAVAALLTSCSKDDTFGGPTRGKVTFEVSTPELATRAYGDGQTAKVLKYAVYDMIEAQDGKCVDYDSTNFTAGSLTTTVSIELVEGRKYSVIFWAESESSPYTFNEEAKTVSYTDVNDLTANNENYDAFFAYVPEDQVKVGETVIVTLKRPFAQLNIATSDKDRAEDLEVIVKQTAVEVQACTTLNLVDGTVSGKQTLKFALADAPDNFQINVPVDNITKAYDVLSTNYLLVNASENVNVTFTFTDMVGTEEKSYVRQYSSIPVQRNYRTNVIGSILTDNTNFNVTIDQDFEDPDKNENVDNNNANNNTFGVATAAELQAALDAATDGATIYFTDDITGDVTATQKEGVKITILGQGHSYKGMITVDGKSARYETAGLTIKDIVFDAESVTGDACIRLGNGNDNSRYTNNVTVDGCTFDVPGAVGVKSYTGGDWNLTIAGCTATEDAHSLAQLANVEKNLIIKDCVANSKNGINLNQTPNVVIDNYTADVKGYAVRFGVSGSSSGVETSEIKNSSLKSANDDGDAAIVIRGAAANSTLNIVNTTIEGDPKIQNNATNATIIIDGVATVSSTEALAAVLNKGFTNINLTAGEYTIPTAAKNKTLTISGSTGNAADVTIKVTGTGAGEGGGQLDYNFDGSTVTFNDLTIKTNSQLYAGFARLSATYNNCIIQNTYNLGVGNSAFNQCTFNITNEYLRVGGAITAVFEECTFNTDGRAILVYQDGTNNAQTVTVKDCTFNATAAAYTWNSIHVAAVSIDGSQGGTYVVNLEGTNTVDTDFNGLWQIKAGEANVTVNE